ncbi:MAG: hypothetical protein AAGC49_12320 [Brevundimonas sp.]
MVLPLTVTRERTVPPQPAETVRWTLRVQRGDRFPGWGWIDRIDTATTSWNDDLGITLVLLGALTALTVPSRLARRIAYRRQGRTDWDLLVYQGWAGLQHQRDAVYREGCADLAAAAVRGDAIWEMLMSEDRLPAND